MPLQFVAELSCLILEQQWELAIPIQKLEKKFNLKWTKKKKKKRTPFYEEMLLALAVPYILQKSLIFYGTTLQFLCLNVGFLGKKAPR